MEFLATIVSALPDSLFLFLAIGVAAVSFFVFRKAAGTMSIYKLNIISVAYYLWLLVMCYSGLVLNILGVENYALRQVSDQSIRMAWIAVSYVMIIMPLSMIFYQKVLFSGNIKVKINNFYSQEVGPLQTRMDSAQKYFWGIFTIVCAGSVIYCYNVVPGTPIFAALSGASIVEIARLRHITTFDFPGNVYVRNLIMDIATPFVSYVAYGYYRTYKTRRAKCWLALSIALALFSLLYTGEIKPVAVYVVGFIILRGIINEGLSKSLLLYSLLSGVLVIGLLTYLTDGVVDISFYGGPLSRLTMIQSFGVALSFDVFPEMHNFLYGGSFPDWMTWLLGVEHEKTGRLLMEIHNPEGVEAGTVGVVASLFVADAYANFGMAGLFLSPLVVGFILQALHSYIAGLPKTPVSISLMVYCMFRLPIISSFTGIIWNVSLIFVVVCVTASVMWRRVMLPPYK